LLRVFGAGLGLLLALGFASLAGWQWQRLQWKEALIARVTAQLTETPAVLPDPADWPLLDRRLDEYRPLRLQGRWLADSEQQVLASTELGRGHWVMTALALEDGGLVWVNRGFVDEAHRAAAAHSAPPDLQALPRTGLLRFPERAWLPGLDHAVRDPQRLSADAGLRSDRTAPFFVDLRTTEVELTWPRAGLTMLQFSNHHLGYAATWVALALGSLLGAALWWRRDGAAGH
jgi:surfeit locus 1 family protein